VDADDVNRAAAPAFLFAAAEVTADRETSMFKPLLCLTLIAAGGLAFAADDATREARRAEWQARAEAKFAEADADRDGTLDRVEAAQLNERLATHFDRVDADRNGELTKEEMRQAHRQHRGGRRGQGRSFMAGLIKGMDDDGNGAINRAELGTKVPALADNFVAIDTDRNNELSVEEIRAHHRARGGEARGDGEHGADHH
jgi:hypothetical protein